MINLSKKIVSKLLGENRYTKLSALKRRGIAATVKYGFRNWIEKPSLQELGEYHQTDKSDPHHTFSGLSMLHVYERYFVSLKNKSINILEIGVKDGASLRTWKAYFESAQVFGIDIDPRCKSFEEERINIAIGSQDDPEFLKECWGGDKKFDIIIDDGSHINKMTLVSFETLFNERLNSGGIYIMEDLACSYSKLQSTHNILETWPGMKYNDPTKSYDNDRSDMDQFFVKKINDLDNRVGNILSMTFGRVHA